MTLGWTWILICPLLLQLNLSSRDYDNHEFSSSNDPKTPIDVDNGSEQVSPKKRWFNPDEDEDESSDTSYSEDEDEYGDDEFL